MKRKSNLFVTAITFTFLLCVMLLFCYGTFVLIMCSFDPLQWSTFPRWCYIVCNVLMLVMVSDVNE